MPRLRNGAHRSAVPTPVMTHVCKRGGRPPSAFRLLPCGAQGAPRQELAHQRVVIESDPYFDDVWIKIGGPAPASQTRSDFYYRIISGKRTIRLLQNSIASKL